MIVISQVLIERITYINTCFFAIQDWKENGGIELIHIPSVINLIDNLTTTKPLG